MRGVGLGFGGKNTGRNPKASVLVSNSPGDVSSLGLSLLHPQVFAHAAFFAQSTLPLLCLFGSSFRSLLSQGNLTDFLVQVRFLS